MCDHESLIKLTCVKHCSVHTSCPCKTVCWYESSKFTVLLNFIVVGDNVASLEEVLMFFSGAGRVPPGGFDCPSTITFDHESVYTILIIGGMFFITTMFIWCGYIIPLCRGVRLASCTAHGQVLTKWSKSLVLPDSRHQRKAEEEGSPF